MKQHISKENLSELSPDQQEKLRSLWQPQQGDDFLILLEYEGIVKEYRNGKVSDYIDPLPDDYIEYDEWDKSQCLPLLNIGQMIDLINEEWKREYNADSDSVFIEISYRVCGHWINGKQCDVGNGKDSLCNALWDAVKSIL